jgi:osmotically-inducible protein OsmY
MKTDAQLKTDVTEELYWDPVINSAHIGVIVKAGVVTLTGHLDTFAQKHAAERAVRRVAGVRAIAIELDVNLASAHKRSDTEIAQAATFALNWNSMVPDGLVKVEVENGWVTLTGELTWRYQVKSAEKCVRHLVGVRGITNSIQLVPQINTTDIGAQISAALKRQAAREAKHIAIKVTGNAVTLEGKVHSLAERDAAVGAAYSAKGVSAVVDRLEVTF